MDEASVRAARRIFLPVAILHVLLLTGGFFALAATFGFPDILRAPAAERMAAFRANEHAIVLSYYAMAMTGVTQIALAVLGYRAVDARGSTLAIGALVAGVLGGAWQTMGFIRWAITIPYLAHAMGGAAPADASTVTLLEGLLNAYAGMAVGEHLGYLGQGFWTMLIAFAGLAARASPRAIGVSGIAFGVAFFVAAALQLLHAPMENEVATIVSAAWLGWLLMFAISLARTKPGESARFGIFSWIGYIALLALFVSATVM